jgi:hypothetical protein
MRTSRVLLITACLLAAPAAALAQDVGIVESAETINKGNFKIRGNPMFVFGKNGEDNKTGIAAMLGYGFTTRFDMEGGVAFYDGLTFVAANAEFWVVKHAPLDISVAGGWHQRYTDLTDDFHGIDLTFLASGHVNKRLELYGGLDLAFEGLGSDTEDFTTVHLVPGTEIKINDSLDFVGEFGIALNDSARHYLTVGLAFYWR